MNQTTHASLLLTDLYEITMAAAFFESGFHPLASFELFVRRLPAQRSYLVAAGLEQALDFLESARFSSREIDLLRTHPSFKHVSPAFFDYLGQLRFTGEVWAVPEGTPVFGLEPLLRVTAPMIEAQLVETFLLTTITFQTSIASKAARIVDAAQGQRVVEFGARRAHGPEAGILAARAAYLSGFAGTSNVEAGFCFGIPTAGTIAHSYVMAMPDELEAFRRYSRIFPETSVLLVDTYDTLAAVDKIIAAGLRPQGIRLDSGNLVELSQKARVRLDSAGLTDTRIFASGDLDEMTIAELIRNGAAIDAFGVGTALATSSDAPALGGVYKLVEVKEGSQKSYLAKFSPDKTTHPGTKQIFRFSGGDGQYRRDLIACAGEKYSDAEPLLTCVMKDGKRTEASPSLEKIRERSRRELARLPRRYRELGSQDAYPVEFSGELERLLERVRIQVMPGADSAENLLTTKGTKAH